MIGQFRRLTPPLTSNGPQVDALLQQLGARQLQPHWQLRGDDFFPSRSVLDSLPSLREAHRQPAAERVLHLHYFTADCHWYIAGFNPRTGWAFGYGEEPGLDLHDWGWFDLNVMCRVLIACDPPVIVRRDLDWIPRPAREVIRPDRLAG